MKTRSGRNTERKSTLKSKIKIDRKQRQKASQQKVKELRNVLSLAVKQLNQELQKQAEVVVNPTANVINDQALSVYSDIFNSDPMNKLRTNAINEVGVNSVSMDRDFLKKVVHAYSHTMPKIPKATAQHYSGRCWLFAAMNSMRSHMIEQFNLNDRFEFSEAYLFFYDKMERSYNFLCDILHTADRPVNDHLFQHLMCNNTPLCDGGNWSYVKNLVLKYGLVPKSVYGESVNSLYTDEMNQLLHDRLVIFAHAIRQNHVDGSSKDQIMSEILNTMMPNIYQLIANCLGEPPKPDEQFTWEFHEAGETFESSRQKGDYHKMEGLTPHLFYQKLVAPHYDIAQMVHLVHDPRGKIPVGRTVTVEYNSAMVGGMPEITFNIPLDEIKHAVARSVMDKQPVWFTCDMGKDFAGYDSLLATEAFVVDSVFNQEFDCGKAVGLDYLSGCPTHAMTIVGLNILDSDLSQISRWQVENSWGSSGLEEGYLQMTDAWFNRHVYSAVVNLQYLPEEYQSLYLEQEYEPLKLPFNDPFGNVANFTGKRRI